MNGLSKLLACKPRLNTNRRFHDVAVTQPDSYSSHAILDHMGKVDNSRHKFFRHALFDTTRDDCDLDTGNRRMSTCQQAHTNRLKWLRTEAGRRSARSCAGSMRRYSRPPSIRYSPRTPCWSPTAAPATRRAPPRSGSATKHSTARLGERVRGDLHVQTVNNRHSRWKDFLRARRGVATRYLENYLSRFHLVGLAPGANDRACLAAAVAR